MTGSLIAWQDGGPKGLGQDQGLFSHHLHHHPAFSDEGLERIIDLYPFERIEIFTMGYNPVGRGEWYLGRISPSPETRPKACDLIEGIRQGRLWLNLRKSHQVVADIDKVCREWFAEIESHLNLKVYKPDIGLLVSSPKAHVFYHLDMPLVMLVQIKGVKRVHLYPAQSPFVGNSELEAIALRVKDEQMVFRPEWDEGAFIHDLKPGEALYWPQNAPHRIVNADCLNVSLSIEYMTAPSLWRANLLYAHGCLRRHFGLDLDIAQSSAVLAPAKIAYGRLIKAIGGIKGPNRLPKPSFTLMTPREGRIEFDEGITLPKPPFTDQDDRISWRVKSDHGRA